MTRTPRSLSALATLATLGLAATTAYAQTATVSGNATVQAAGPRTGANGLAFLNVEGNGNLAAFRSYGTIDFTTAGFASVASVDTLTFTLSDAPAGFSSAGPVNVDFYVTTDTTTSDSNAAGASPLKYNPASFLTGTSQGQGVDTTQFASGAGFYLLGTGSYSKTTVGSPFTYTFSPTGAAETYLTSQVNANGALRFLVAADADAVAATYAGATNSTVTSRPQLSIAVTNTVASAPEPSGTVALLAGALTLGVLATRRRVRPA